MALRYLLDTNTCIYIRGKQPKVVARFEKLDAGDVGISIVTYGELAYGVAKSAASDRAIVGLERFIAAIPVLPMPIEAGQIYGHFEPLLKSKERSSGRMICGSPRTRSRRSHACHQQRARVQACEGPEN